MERLKKCPFCGKIPRIEIFKYGTYRTGRLELFNIIHKCDILGEVSLPVNDTKEKVIERWNKRV